MQFWKISILPMPQKELKFLGVVEFCKTQKMKEMYEGLVEFPEGAGGVLKIPPVGEVWVFSGTTQFSTCTNPIIHLFYPPKICIGIVLDYSWDMFMSQEKLQTMSMQNFWGVKEVHYGIVQVVNGSSGFYKIVN